MKKPPPVALIGSGKLTDSPVTRLLRRSSALGPVMSPSFRVASRIANSLRAGHPAKDYSDLDTCRLILISVPDDKLAKVVQELAASTISWSGKAVVLCSAWLGSSELGALSASGAAIGSLSPIPCFEFSRYLLEGDSLAIREMRGLMEHGMRQVVAVARGCKPLYLASLTCTGSLAFAAIFAASESLRLAGVSAAESSEIMEKQVAKTVRSYLKAGRKAFPEVRELSKQFAALAKHDPKLARYLEESTKLWSHFLG